MTEYRGQSNILGIAKKISFWRETFLLTQIYVLNINFRGIYVVHNIPAPFLIKHYRSESYLSY